MKKKNLFGWLAMAAMVLGTTGCSNDEVVNDYSAENAIEFGTYIGRNAEGRGTVLDNTVATGLPQQGFGVFAYYTDDADYNASNSSLNFMNNTHVKSTDGTNWIYSPVKYWPNEATDKLSFFAYAPYDENQKVTAATGDPILNFTVAGDVTNQIDLVVAKNEHINLTKQTINGNVNFNFAHVLSKVGFKVEAVIDETNEPDATKPDTDSQTNAITDKTVISVQEVELIGAFNNSGKINLNTSTWTDKAVAAETKYSLTSSDFTNVANDVTISAQQLNKDSEYMMLIPTETMSIKIRVKYTVTTTDPDLTGGKSEVVNDITSNYIAFTFDQGKAYTFVLHLGLTSVNLSATVNEWDNAGDIVVNVPMNKEI